MITNPGISDLNDCFCNYEKVQTRHLDSLNSDSVPDIALMISERANVFDILKTTLEVFIKNAGNKSENLSILTRYETRLASIMTLDEQIKKHIQKHRNNLKDGLNHMKKGKLAMAGYSSTGKNPKAPCVLSMNR